MPENPLQAGQASKESAIGHSTLKMPRGSRSAENSPWTRRVWSAPN